MKRIISLLLVFLLLFSLCACQEEINEDPVELDLDTIAAALTLSGYFPDNLEVLDPAFVPGTLSLYEDRIEAVPEDLVDARHTMALGIVADEFILLEGLDESATDRLEKALNTYAEDRKSAFEFYNPEQAARLDDPIIKRNGNYLLFAIGVDDAALEDLCVRLINGEVVEFNSPAQNQGAVNLDTNEIHQENETTSAEQNENEFTPPQNDTSKPESETTSDISENENEALLPVDIEAAQQAALDYYKGTVFAIHTLTQIDLLDGWEGEVMFRVSCTKGGEPQVDRTIALSRQNGSWIVVGEGY